MHGKSLVTFPVAVSLHLAPHGAGEGGCCLLVTGSSVPHLTPPAARGMSGVLISTLEKIPSLLPSLISVLERIQGNIALGIIPSYPK